MLQILRRHLPRAAWERFVWRGFAHCKIEGTFVLRSAEQHIRFREQSAEEFWKPPCTDQRFAFRRELRAGRIREGRGFILRIKTSKSGAMQPERLRYRCDATDRWGAARAAPLARSTGLPRDVILQ